MRALIEDPFALGAAAAAFGTVAALIIALRYALVPSPDAIDERLERAVVRGAGAGRQGLTRNERASTPLARLLRALSRLSRPSAAEELSRTRARLDHGGLRGSHAVEVFFGAKIALSLLLAGGFVIAGLASSSPIPHASLVTVTLAALGFIAPNLWLRGRIAERQRVLARSLPDTLDLLVTCVEAGLSVEAALARVVNEVGLSAPLLALELSQSMLEIRAGVPRGEAFRRLAARTGLEDLQGLAATLIQTELFGTSVARALRIQATGMRQKRSHRAEERAATVATKMLLPLILCVLPALITVIMGPAIVRITRVLLPSLGGPS